MNNTEQFNNQVLESNIDSNENTIDKDISKIAAVTGSKIDNILADSSVSDELRLLFGLAEKNEVQETKELTLAQETELKNRLKVEALFGQIKGYMNEPFSASSITANDESYSLSA